MNQCDPMIQLGIYFGPVSASAFSLFVVDRFQKCALAAVIRTSVLCSKDGLRVELFSVPSVSKFDVDHLGKSVPSLHCMIKCFFAPLSQAHKTQDYSVLLPSRIVQPPRRSTTKPIAFSTFEV